MNKKNKKKGFTLVELIVVIAILGVLAVIMIPSFTGYVAKASNTRAHSEAASFCTVYQAAYVEAEIMNTTLQANPDIIDQLWHQNTFHSDGQGKIWFESKGSNIKYKALGENGVCEILIVD
ncbi:MAG: type IV pilin protein [Erysipelotrichaceae bacterium]